MSCQCHGSMIIEPSSSFFGRSQPAEMAPPQLSIASTAIKINDHFNWEEFKQRLRKGKDRCMSKSGEHLKDEVDFNSSSIMGKRLYLTGNQGSKTQVIIAGATAGLIAR